MERRQKILPHFSSQYSIREYQQQQQQQPKKKVAPKDTNYHSLASHNRSAAVDDNRTTDKRCDFCNRIQRMISMQIIPHGKFNRPFSVVFGQSMRSRVMEGFSAKTRRKWLLVFRFYFDVVVVVVFENIRDAQRWSLIRIANDLNT